VSKPDEHSAEHRFAERAFLAGYRQCGEEVKPMVDELKAKVSALQAEVEELKELVKFLRQADSYLQSANQNVEMERSIQLEVENERLRRAGRGLRAIAEGTYCVIQPEPVKEWDAIDGDAWRAAKGVQP
jgi:predicted RNase H-like nuclease (RuvC/YqgF family)